MVRQGIRQLLELEDEFEVVGEASNGIETLEAVNKYQPDVLLMDINMPKMNGLKTLEELRKNHSNQKVILLIIHDEAEYLFQAVDLGVDGYIVKDADAEELIQAVKMVHKGEGYIHPTMTAYLLHRVNSEESIKRKKEKNDWGLTAREVEVLELIVKGKINKEIAESLVISEKTVKNHVSNIFKKMEVYDRTQAAVQAIKAGLIHL